MVILGLGLVLLMGMQVFAAQISNMIFSPVSLLVVFSWFVGRKAPIYDECLQGSFQRSTCSNCVLDGAFAPSFGRDELTAGAQGWVPPGRGDRPARSYYYLIVTSKKCHFDLNRVVDNPYYNFYFPGKVGGNKK